MAAPLTLATLYDAPLIDLGDCASNIMGDSYALTQRWAQLLYAHSLPAVDGLMYRSRFRTDQFCVALFERAIGPRGIQVVSSRDISPAVCAETRAIMRRYKVLPI